MSMAICCRPTVARRRLALASCHLLRHRLAFSDDTKNNSSGAPNAAAATATAGKSLVDLLIEMPKEQNHLPELRRRRKEKRKQLSRFPSDICDMELYCCTLSLC